MAKSAYVLALASFAVPFVLTGCSTTRGRRANAPAATIVSPTDATPAEYLAAKEVRRYVYLRTGELLPIARSTSTLPKRTNLIIVGQKDRPGVKTLTGKDTTLASNGASKEGDASAEECEEENPES